MNAFVLQKLEMDFNKMMTVGPRMSQHQMIQYLVSIFEMGSQLKKNGLVNGDIKPQNMMVDKNKQLFMVDTDTIH